MSAKEETTVSFAELKDEELKAYIDSGEPFDKAGGYGIQARKGQEVKKNAIQEPMSPRRPGGISGHYLQMFVGNALRL